MDLFDSPVPDYNKVMLIINTCVTLEQLEYSEKYVELFKLKYKINEYNEFNQIFKKCIFSKKMKFKKWLE